MRVIGLCKRPLAKETARLPEDPRLEMHTGLDLTNAELALRRLAVIADIAAVTHVYFVGEFVSFEHSQLCRTLQKVTTFQLTRVMAPLQRIWWTLTRQSLTTL